MYATTEMIEAGAKYLYGNSRKSAIAACEEAKFQACCIQAEALFNIMMEVHPSDFPRPTQQQLAAAEPVSHNPSIW